MWQGGKNCLKGGYKTENRDFKIGFFASLLLFIIDASHQPFHSVELPLIILKVFKEAYDQKQFWLFHYSSMDLYFTQTISTFAATAIFSFEDKVYMQIMPLLFNFIKLLSKKN